MRKDIPYNPIFYRDNIIDLCDVWGFSMDNEKYFPINVPFCPESKLSGIGYTDFIRKCFYRKKFNYEKSDKHLWIHFGACDYETKVYLNDSFVGSHIGGYTPFELDLTFFVKNGENTLFLEVIDDNYLHKASGKQSFRDKSFGCFYTRTTGIWQPVWLEERDEYFIKSVKFYPSIKDQLVNILLEVNGKGIYTINVYFEDKIVGSVTGQIDKSIDISIPLSEKHLWNIFEGNIYNVDIIFNDDIVHSYFGLREVKYEGYDFLLNDKSLYGNYVLHQGYNQDGIYTEPTFEFMEHDIEIVKESGFNGIRLHQKIFDPRFLYLCDINGLMCWGEFPNWGIDFRNMDEFDQFAAEWKEVIDRDFNHPSIVTWCPLNEVWDNLFDKSIHRDINFIDSTYDLTKKLDNTRPCCDVSGGHHGTNTDLFDFHNYEAIDNIKECLKKFDNDDILDCNFLYPKDESVPAPRYKKGQAVNLSECGGFTISQVKKTEVATECVQSEEAWGYGDGASSNSEFVRRYVELIELIKSFKKISGFCYTQLFDIEQEKNGIYTYDRTCKLSKEELKQIREVNLK